MAANLELVPATAGKRLGAAVLDWLAPAAVLVATFAIGFAGITRTQSGGFIIYDTGSLVLFGGIGLGLTLVYLVVLLGMESRSGKTLGNHVMGIRSADKDGYAPGGGGVFLRGPITGTGIILTLLAAVAIVIFKWFDAAVFILGPLLLIGAVWAVLVAVSNTWDRKGRLRGWHDSAAKTLVFDVKDGRNPITSGGIQGPYSFAPLDLPPVQQVASPVAGAAKAPQVVNPYAPQPEVAQPLSAPPSFAPQPYAPPSSAPFQATPVAVLRIKLGDGRDFQLDRNVLVGRNPTNGSAVTTPDGRRTPLQPGVPAFVSPGSTVHFGARSFHLGQA